MLATIIIEYETTMTKEYENILRRIINLKLGTNDNSNFKISPDRIEKWKEKREIETKKYKGVNMENRIIYYSDFYDLKTIIVKNWEFFKDVLIEKKKFEVYFDQVETFRNTITHGRDLLSYQEDLLNGITGDLKTSLVKYHNKNMNADDYFIKILKISDSLGNIWDLHSGSIGMITESVLRVGDYLELNIDAYDPKGREIEYEIYHKKFGFSNKTGKFQITITEKMVGNPLAFSITAETSNTEYPNKEQRIIHYIVLP